VKNDEPALIAEVVDLVEGLKMPALKPPAS
jgi:hypothetical protein